MNKSDNAKLKDLSIQSQKVTFSVVESRMRAQERNRELDNFFNVNDLVTAKHEMHTSQKRYPM